MMLRYNVKGPERKALVAAIAEILGQKAEYQKLPTKAYRIGEYAVDVDGALTGPDNHNLAAELEKRGFCADGGESAENGEANEPGRLTISVPAESFSPEALANLRKLVDSKAPLIKKALGIDALPIEVTDCEVGFPWFAPDLDSESITAYSQFVAALCKTAKTKTRVTAREREFTNEKFSLRVFEIGLGMIGPEFRLIRRLLAMNLSGNSAWSSGVDPRRKPKGEADKGGEAE